jgi:hypothetical protein
MARETKAQREAREAFDRAQELAQAEASYVDRLMGSLRRAVKYNFELDVAETDRFLLVDRDDTSELFYVSPTWSKQADDELEDLNQAVDYKVAVEDERNRRRRLREQALSKLSPEEREVLNV